ncbi:MAG: ImpA family type VI secretion system protein, partial [Planctomycetaceae bacterium]
MATPDVLEFERLLAPISDEQPAGPELKEDEALSNVYYGVKDAREAARSAERQLLMAGDEGADLSPPDWRTVRERAVEALATKSKDLWIAAWLIEALCRLDGFAGLRDGFRLVREMAERYWDGIHPVPDEDGVATTVAQLTGLNGEDSEGALIAPIKLIPITEPGSYDPLTFADYDKAA